MQQYADAWITTVTAPSGSTCKSRNAGDLSSTLLRKVTMWMVFRTIQSCGPCALPEPVWWVAEPADVGGERRQCDPRKKVGARQMSESASSGASFKSVGTWKKQPCELLLAVTCSSAPASGRRTAGNRCYTKA